MLFIVQIIPNIWWCYSNTLMSNSIDDYSQNDKYMLSKFIEFNNIKQTINIDKHVNFWNHSQQFIIDIKLQLQKYEYQQLKSFLIKICELIKQNNLNNKKTLIITAKHNDIGLVIWIYFFHIYAEIKIDLAENLLYKKMVWIIPISEYLHKILSIITM